MPTLAQESRRVDELLDTRQKARFKQLASAERLLFTKLIQELRAELTESNGRITSRKGFVSLGKAIDTIFDEVEKQELGEMGRSVVADMAAMVDATSARYRNYTRPKGGSFPEIQQAVSAELARRLGLTENGVRGDGYLGQLITNQNAREEVKRMVHKAVVGGIPMKKLEDQLRVKVQGTPQEAGVLESHIGGYVLDAYQVADAITNNEFAKRLDLKYFVYSGGLIETTRPFCRKRNNKVFAVWEVADWVLDPTLPRTKAEEDSGTITDYDPLVDRGRWRCRHRILYISQEEAYRLRPELEEIERIKFGLPADSKATKVERPETLKDAPAKAPPLRAGNGLEPPVLVDKETRSGPAQMPGSVAYELRELHRASRKQSQFKPVNPNAEKTIDMYTGSDGKLTPERQAMHDQIIADALANVTPVESPVMYMMGGGPASGKSTLIKSGVVTHPDNHVLVNGDEFKEDLPEYRDWVKARDVAAASRAHDESSVLTKRAARAAAARSQTVVWDGTGDGTIEKLRTEIDVFRSKGYRVVADYVTVPTEVAVDRAQKRGERTGRFVPLSLVRATHRDVSRIFPIAVAEGLFDEVTLWDTSTGEQIKVASAKGRNLVIHHRGLWETFLAKGNETLPGE